MNLTNFVARKVFQNLTDLKEGATLDDVEAKLSGLETELAGLSDTEKVALFEETTPLKSYVDAKVNKALDGKKTELSGEFETERQKLTSQLEELRAKVPMDDLESLKKAWLDAPDKEKPAKKRDYEFAKMQADLESLRKEKETADAEVRKAKLLDVARTELGERKLPPYVKLDHYIGTDEAETIERIKQISKNHDEYLKTLNAGSTKTETPPDGGEPTGFDLASAMQGAGTF